MENLPSVWGRHKEALIDPVVVRDRLITSIMDAPASWAERLDALGFKRASQSWLRLGAMTPSEYQYLSPEIDLIGLRLDAVIDLPNGEQEQYQTEVPLDVRDTLIQLWQRQAASMLVALSMEHDANYTRSQAWTFVETALAGSITPETETLYGLAFTKMSKENRMSPDALAYANSLGWKGVPSQVGQAASGRGRLLLHKGESVQWADSEGVVSQGRLAQRVHETDPGCWVYKDSPRWAGGYVVAAPIWVQRQQLQFRGSASDYYEPEVSAPVRAISSGEALISELPISSSQQMVLNRFLDAYRQFPSPEWRDLGAAIRENLNYAFGDKLTLEEFDDAMQWLENAEQALSRLSEHYYGQDPIAFVFTGSTLNTELSLHCTLSKDYAIWSRHKGLIENGVVQLGKTAEKIEVERRARERSMQESGLQLGEKFGIEGAVLSKKAFLATPMIWQKVSLHYGGQIPGDAALRILAVTMGGGDQADYLMRRSSRNLLSDALQSKVSFDPEKGNGSLAVRIYKEQASIVPLNAALEALSNNAVMDSLPVVERMIYILEGDYTGQAILPELDDSALSSVCVKKTQQVMFLTPEAALDAYRDIIKRVEPYSSAQQKGELQNIKAIIDAQPLRERFMAASRQLQSMDQGIIENFIKSEMMRQLKARFSDWSEEYVGRVASSAVAEMRKPDAQGVMVIASSTGRTYRTYSKTVPFRDEALTQSRLAELQGAATEYKSRQRIRGVAAVIDGIALVDPELCNILNGEEAVLKAGESETKDIGGYADTGVVAGLAIKDIRGFDRSTLARHADNMNDAQKAKYLTKDLIWPRRSFEEMKEAGVPLPVAFAYDVFWKGLPSKAKSPSREHTAVFVNLLALLKENVGPLLDKYADENRLKSDERVEYKDFSDEISRVTRQIAEELPSLTKVYSYRERKIRGVDCHWSHYNPAFSSKVSRGLSMAWTDVLKEKKVAKAGATSRVTRDEVQREGPDYRKGYSVSGEDFIKTFGFSGIEYGNWTNQKEREKHLNFAYDSMMDFARILGWEPMALSLGGKLGLCIGSRGHGGKNPANAHFEPANMAINLTRMRGDGALAHEYFHAVANHYGRISTGASADVTDSFGYALQREGDLPPKPVNGLRGEVNEAFVNLVAAIMRAPAEGSPVDDIAAYTERSPMLKASMTKDGRSGDYWGSPREMFARAMEIWFKERMSEIGERNDYLVRAGKGDGSELYPDAKHLERINHFASPWLDALKTEVRMVDHPHLGEIEMPILYTEHRSRVPLSANDLMDLAKSEMERLFQNHAPGLMITQAPGLKAGLYDLSRNLIMLNAEYADSGTFYHEAWHACHGQLLTGSEQDGLDHLFAPDSPVVTALVEVMRAEGYSEAVIEHASSSSAEAQAYAFQLWADQKFSFDSELIKTFYSTRGFVDGVVAIGDLFGPGEADLLFRRFMQGELASRKGKRNTQQTDEHEMPEQNAVVALNERDGDMLFWPVEEVVAEAGRQQSPRSSMRME